MLSRELIQDSTQTTKLSKFLSLSLSYNDDMAEHAQNVKKSFLLVDIILSPRTIAVILQQYILYPRNAICCKICNTNVQVGGRMATAILVASPFLVAFIHSQVYI